MENKTALEWNEILTERGKQVTSLARKVIKLEAENRTLRRALRELAARVSQEAWEAVNAELDHEQ